MFCGDYDDDDNDDNSDDDNDGNDCGCDDSIHLMIMLITFLIKVIMVNYKYSEIPNKHICRIIFLGDIFHSILAYSGLYDYFVDALPLCTNLIWACMIIYMRNVCRKYQFSSSNHHFLC